MKTHWKNWALVSVLAAAGLVVGQSLPRASADDDEEEGRIVEIGPGESDDHVDLNIRADQKGEHDEPAAEAPTYWLGIQGSPIDSPVLRTHLQLAGDLGAVVADVMPNSPAEKAGLRKHDILVGVNGEPVNDMTVIQKAVADVGKKPLTLKVIRLAKEMTVEVTPEDMPAEFAAAAAQGQGLPGGIDGDMNLQGLQGMLDELQGRELPNMRMIGPGVVLNGGQLNLNALPDGMSVSVSREGDGPAQVTVKKGDKTWTVEGDDKEAIAKLPDDIRPIVEGMLHGSGAMRINLPNLSNLNFDMQLREMLPGQLGGRIQNGDLDAQRKEMMKRMEDLEKRMEKFQRQLQEDLQEENSQPAADPSTT